MLEQLTHATLLAAAFAFTIGFLLTAGSGSARPVKFALGLFCAIVIAGLAAGLIISGGLLVFVLFQLLTLAIILAFVLVAGALCGGALHALLRRNARGGELGEAELGNYLPLDEFCRREGIDPERALSRISNGFYAGGRCRGTWYIARKELS